MTASQRKDVGEFDQDAAAGGYLYTRPGKLSTRLSNARMSRAILAASDFAAKRVIDLGCGDGAYTLEIVSIGGAASAVGIDPAPAAVSAATDRARLCGIEGCSFRVADIYSLEPVSGPMTSRCLEACFITRTIPRERLPSLSHWLRSSSFSSPTAAIRYSSSLSGCRLITAHMVSGRSFLPRSVDGRDAQAAGLRRNGRSIWCPCFAPDWLARFCNTVEPMVEALPLLRNLACGQYVFRFER